MVFHLKARANVCWVWAGHSHPTARQRQRTVTAARTDKDRRWKAREAGGLERPKVRFQIDCPSLASECLLGGILKCSGRRPPASGLPLHPAHSKELPTPVTLQGQLLQPQRTDDTTAAGTGREFSGRLSAPLLSAREFSRLPGRAGAQAPAGPPPAAPPLPGQTARTRPQRSPRPRASLLSPSLLPCSDARLSIPLLPSRRDEDVCFLIYFQLKIGLYS